MPEKIEGRKRGGQQRTKWLDDITNAMKLSLSMLWEMVDDREAWHAVVHGVTESDMTYQLNNSNKNMGRKFDKGSTVALDIHLVLD